MNGLEKIAVQIRLQAQQEADAIVDRAQQEAAGQIAAAETECAQSAAQNADKARAEAETECARAVSAAAAEGRRQLLAEKQEQIAAVLSEARRRLEALPDAEYFALMQKMAVENSQTGDGRLIFSDRDRARMPADFEARLNDALAGRGTLHIAAEHRPIQSGFVLVYGDIEENCTLEAQLEARREELQDLICRILFD